MARMLLLIFLLIPIGCRTAEVRVCHRPTGVEVVVQVNANQTL